jgi:hypothetical protein
MPTEIIFGNKNADTESITSYGDYVEILRERMCTAHRVAQRQLGIVAKRQKGSLQNARKNPIIREKLLVYEVGELVWYLHEANRRNFT